MSVFTEAFHQDGDCPECEELRGRLHAAEVERDVALVQLREQNEKLDRTESGWAQLRDSINEGEF